MSFLKCVMRRLGFQAEWIELIMTCIITVSFKILCGGKEIGPIIPQRSLMQKGIDPLFLYLFIICAKALSALICARERAGAIHGCKIALRSSGCVTSLFC